MNYPHLSLFVKRVTHSQSQEILYGFAFRPILRCEMGRFTLRNGPFYSAKWAVSQCVVYQCVMRCLAKDSCCGDYLCVMRVGECGRL